MTTKKQEEEETKRRLTGARPVQESFASGAAKSGSCMTLNATIITESSDTLGLDMKCKHDLLWIPIEDGWMLLYPLVISTDAVPDYA